MGHSESGEWCRETTRQLLVLGGSFRPAAVDYQLLTRVVRSLTARNRIFYFGANLLFLSRMTSDICVIYSCWIETYN